ncbi:MAG: response regulator transcription factor [Cellvibrionaceae bacterium]
MTAYPHAPDAKVRTRILVISVFKAQAQQQASKFKQTLFAHYDDHDGVEFIATTARDLRSNALTANILAIDCSKLISEIELSPLLHQLNQSHPQCPIALLNCPAKMQGSFLTQWAQVKGVLNSDVSAQLLTKAIDKLLNNQVWMPRSILEQYFLEQKSDETITELPLEIQNTHITEKEQQILSLLVSGAKNAEIAFSLRIQENTVKSHLYNLYKKIQVRNRQEAANWARKYLALVA